MHETIIIIIINNWLENDKYIFKFIRLWQCILIIEQNALYSVVFCFFKENNLCVKIATVPLSTRSKRLYSKTEVALYMT
jgi:hypothetical protein